MPFPKEQKCGEQKLGSVLPLNCSNLPLLFHLKYFGHLMRRKDSLEKSLMLGAIEAKEEGDDRE